MDILHAAILGIVEGVTEFLPISSTGHLILTSRLLGMETTPFLKSFEISIQLGAILAVVLLYSRQLFVDREVLKRVCIAFIPTGVVGFLLYKVLKSFLLGNIPVVLWSLFLGGIVLILFEMRYKEKDHAIRTISGMSYWQAFLIGLIQSLSIVPGVSRAGATIIGGLLAGLDRKTIVEFSFLLAVPTMMVATGYDLFKNGYAFSSEDIKALIVGFLVSFLVAGVVIKSFISFVQRYNFIVFGVYRILLALFFWLTPRP